MRKKSHLSLGNYLIKAMKLSVLQQHRKAFLVGCILPDCRPSFVTKRHEFVSTYGEVQEKIRSLTMDWEDMLENPRSFWIRVGEVLHFVADYFTYPHNSCYEGSLKEHCKYENRLKHYLKFYIFSGKVWKNQEKPLRFENVEELFLYIEGKHREYLEEKCGLSSDVAYITQVCFQVIAGIFQLVDDRIREEGFCTVSAA